MNRYLHLSFNHHLQNVLDVLKAYQNTKWCLHRVVPISDTQSILILESWDSWANDKDEEVKAPHYPHRITPNERPHDATDMVECGNFKDHVDYCSRCFDKCPTCVRNGK